MQFYSTGTPSVSLVHETWSLVDADIVNYPLNDVTRRINTALEELIAMIINADGTWQHDDSAYTDLPVGTGTLVEGQTSYSFASEYLQIEHIKVLSSDSVWNPVKPIDEQDLELTGMTIEQYFAVSGLPEYYDVLGDTIKLYPAPTATAVTLSNGLKVHFKRTADLFTVSDTTQSPGLPSTHHVLLAYMAAIPYAMAYKPERVGWLEKKVMEMKKTLMEHYGQREKDRRKVMSTRPINFR